jgi:hypothetical protein
MAGTCQLGTDRLSVVQLAANRATTAFSSRAAYPGGGGEKVIYAEDRTRSFGTLLLETAYTLKSIGSNLIWILPV